MSNVTTTSQETFKDDVLGAERPVLVDFYADWCGPCKIIGPIVEDLASDYEGRVDVRKVDVDDNSNLTTHFGIRGIPTLMLFKNGEPVETVVGVTSKTELANVLDRHVA